MDDDEPEFCDCECRCDLWDKANDRGQYVLIVLLLVFLSFVWTDGWGQFRDC